MKLSVILCTYNRSQRLEKALHSVAVSNLPPSVDWEVLVIDNNSKDQTRQVIEEFCQRYPGRFHYVFEPQQGKSHALNRGIREAQGDVLAFMDDDVHVHPDWLRNLIAGLDSGEWSGSGGRIILEWPEDVPNWIVKSGPLARHGFPAFDQGDLVKALVGPPFGTNMAFRKEVFQKHGGFRLDLGPSPTNEIRAEDTEFGRRVIAGGERLRYEPDALVYHPVFTEQLSQTRLLRWWFDNGRATAREFAKQPLYEACSLAAWTVRWLAASDPAIRFHHKLVVWEKMGIFKELRHQLLHSKKRDFNVIKETKTECKV